MKINIQTSDIVLCGLSDFLFIREPGTLAEATAAIDSQLLHTLADKVDPAVLEAAGQAAANLGDAAAVVG